MTTDSIGSPLYNGSMEPKSKFWIERDGELILSDWRVALLEAIEETGSLSAAARKLGVHHRRARAKVDEIEARLGLHLVEGESGGSGGGGTRLTPAAREYIRRYRRFQEGLKELVDRRFREYFGDMSSSV